MKRVDPLIRSTPSPCHHDAGHGIEDHLDIIGPVSSGLNGARKPRDPRPKANVGGIGVASSKY